MKKTLLILVLFFSMNIAAWASNNSIFIPNITKKQAIDTIVTDKIQNNWIVSSQNDYLISFKQTSYSAVDVAVWGSRFNPNPERRLQYSIVPDGNGVLISFSGQIVSNPNSGYENSTEFGQKTLSNEIEHLREMFEGYCTYFVNCGKLFNFVVVTYVNPDSIAYKNGLRESCRIIKINGQDVKNFSNKDIIETFKPVVKNQELNITYIEHKKSEPKNLTLKSIYIKPTYGQNL